LAKWSRGGRGWRPRTSDGPLFRAIDRHGRIATSLTDRAIALIIKPRRRQGSIPPDMRRTLGCATEAMARGVEGDIGRHILGPIDILIWFELQSDGVLRRPRSPDVGGATAVFRKLKHAGRSWTRLKHIATPKVATRFPA
jgi:hypothetical protein